MTPQILLYNMQNSRHRQKLKVLLLRLKIRVRLVEKEQYSQPVGTLCGMVLSNPLSQENSFPDSTEDFDDEMMIFAGFTDHLLDQFLVGLRKSGIQIPLKAVLTPTNCTWNSYAVHREIASEHARMHANI